jgi:HK97 family phage major capsid protein
MNTIPIYLVALIVAIANTPTNIFQVCQRNVGTLKIDPWRQRSSLLASGRAALSQIATWFKANAFCLSAALACLILLVALTPHGAHGAVLAFPVLAAPARDLKPLRQRAADLKGEIAKLSKERADIGTAAVTEKRALTDEERTKFAALGPQIEAVKSQLADTELMLTAAEEANAAEKSATIRPVADPDATAATAAATGLQVGESAEEKAIKSPAFFGQALHAVRKIVMHEATEADRKVVRMLAGPTGASSDVPSDGGFLIAPERSNVILQRMYDTGAVASLVTRQPIGANSNGIVLPAIDETSRADGSRYGGVASAWVGQGTTTTAGKPKFRAMELKLKKLLAFVYGTDELILDAAAFSAFVNRILPLELLFRLEDAIVNGDGSNKPAGFLNSGAAITVTRNTANRVLYEDVSGMWKRMWAPLRATAVWMIEQSVEQELEQMSIAIGTAGVLAPIYRPAGISVGPNGTQGYSPATLYGRPILTTEYNAALGTVGDIMLVNLGEYTVIDKGGVDQAVSLHVAFLTDEQVWRFTYRADGQLNWNAALTPKSGGSTLSCVVTLT